MTSRLETTFSGRRVTARWLEGPGAVALGGALGTGVRYSAISSGHGPAITVLVLNVVGSAVLGALIAHRSSRDPGGMHDRWTALIGIGFCGGLTTFSTHVVDVAQRLEDGHWRDAGVSLAVTSVLCVAAALSGHLAMHRLDTGRPPDHSP